MHHSSRRLIHVIYMHMHVYMCVCMYMYIYVYVCMYVCIIEREREYVYYIIHYIVIHDTLICNITSYCVHDTFTIPYLMK
jgi:hypothetical protein